MWKKKKKGFGVRRHGVRVLVGGFGWVWCVFVFYRMTHLLLVFSFLPLETCATLFCLRISLTSSKKHVSLLILCLADVSKNAQPHFAARPAPSDASTARSVVRSHLLPTSTLRTCAQESSQSGTG